MAAASTRGAQARAAADVSDAYEDGASAVRLRRPAASRAAATAVAALLGEIAADYKSLGRAARGSQATRYRTLTRSIAAGERGLDARLAALGIVVAR